MDECARWMDMVTEKGYISFLFTSEKDDRLAQPLMDLLLVTLSSTSNETLLNLKVTSEAPCKFKMDKLGTKYSANYCKGLSSCWKLSATPAFSRASIHLHDAVG